MCQIVAVNPGIAEKFENFMKNGRILLFRAPCGFGKTTLAKALLKKKRVREILPDKNDITELSAKDDWEVLLADDIHLLQDYDEQQALCSLMRDNPDRRFVFLTRGMSPGWLMHFGFSGLMVTIEADEMFLKRGTASKFFKDNGVMLRDVELTEIMRNTMGYPLALAILARHMRGGEKFGSKLSTEATHEIFNYYDEVIYRRFELPMRRFLLELAPFEKFDTELAKMVSGDLHAGELLSQIRQNTCMLQINGLDEFHFWPIFRDFLMWKQESEYTVEQQRALYSRGGLYFELHENYAKALEYYSKSADRAKVSELLIKTMNMHPGMGHYEDLERYFFSLTDAQLLSSPALMQGMSMLCALRADYGGSQRWYGELKDFAAARDKTDAAAREARSRMIYLDIALPQRKTMGLVKTITAAFNLITNREITLPPFSVTSTLPSIMNGGKDFSEWSKKDDFLYATMRTPVETVLGKDGIGLPDCAIAESKFEKGEEVSNRILTLVSKLSEVQSRGTPDIEFAIVGLFARSQIDAGQAHAALETVSTLRGRFAEKGLGRFLPNIDAMLCRIALRLCDEVYIDEWYRDKAPKNNIEFRTMKRYQYITQAMAELARGDNEAVLVTLAQLEMYCTVCGRHIDMIHIKTLSAVARYRKGDALWKDDINTALDIAREYKFVRTVGEYGAAVLPLLAECGRGGDKRFFDRVVKTARGQAVYYPDFLKPLCQPEENLTEAEIQVLRLVCADKSNAEIGMILGIKLATVKSHVSHILQKLGVTRRSEAKTVAQKKHLL